MTNERKWETKLGIRTVGRDAARADAHHLPYEPTPYAVLERLAGSGWIGRENFLIDFGCGLGRVSLFLSAMTGCRSMGIDFNPVFIEGAEENRRRCAGRADVRFLCVSAERFEVPPDADRFYFFNPFSPETMRSVHARLLGSWYENPRPLSLFFYYPSDEFVRFLTGAPGLLTDGELDFSDLFPGDRREVLLRFRAEG